MSQTNHAGARRTRVVIIGCGFAGLEAARRLSGKAVDVTVVERTNHHLFQPLLYQVATAGLAAPSIAAPVRSIFRKQTNATTLLGEVVGIDAQQKTVELGNGAKLEWDKLIVAAGATHSYFGNDAWSEHAPGLKTLADAFEIRRRVLMNFEAAEVESRDEAQRALLTFAVVGAGPTGVEMAGALAEIARQTLKDEFRRIDPASAEVLLIEGGPRVLQTMPPELSGRAVRQLRDLGVQVRLNAKVTAIDAEGIEVSTPFSEGGAGTGTHRIPTRCVIWAAGVAASPLGKLVAQATGAELDRAGRVQVMDDLTVAGQPDIYVVGDLAAATSQSRRKERTSVPGVSPAAKQMGRAAAENILRQVVGKTTSPFRYADYGSLATIGRNSAIVDLGTPFGPLRFSGRLAWMFWLLAHVYFLIGFRNRMVVLMDWASAYCNFTRHARVVADTWRPRRRAGLM
jgi:NADH dehydrogenase